MSKRINVVLPDKTAELLDKLTVKGSRSDFINQAVLQFAETQSKRIAVADESDSSRRIEQAWIDQHQAQYAGAWVALDGEKLVAHGSSAREVLEAAKTEGYDQPLVVHVPSEPALPFGGW